MPYRYLTWSLLEFHLRTQNLCIAKTPFVPLDKSKHKAVPWMTETSFSIVHSCRTLNWRPNLQVIICLTYDSRDCPNSAAIATLGFQLSLLSHISPSFPRYAPFFFFSSLSKLYLCVFWFWRDCSFRPWYSEASIPFDIHSLNINITMSEPIIYRTPPLAGRPPFATDEPDSIYAQSSSPTRRVRQQASPSPNSRTSAYNMYVTDVHAMPSSIPTHVMY